MNLPMPRFLHTPATRLARLVIALGLIGGLAGAPLAATDLHAYWDQRCAGCHGHAGDFSRRFLMVEGDRLLGWHQKERLPQFLRNHYAADEYADAIHAMLLAQRQQQPIYREKCAGCHQSAAELVRASIIVRDGRLTTRRGQRDLAEFLGSHGGLAAGQLPELLESLERVMRETGTGAP
ncbi:MAG: hypothetical protein WCF44_05015 [Candidatus Methylophosphatis roskildensis]